MTTNDVTRTTQSTRQRNVAQTTPGKPESASVQHAMNTLQRALGSRGARDASDSGGAWSAANGAGSTATTYSNGGGGAAETPQRAALSQAVPNIVISGTRGASPAPDRTPDQQATAAADAAAISADIDTQPAPAPYDAVLGAGTVTAEGLRTILEDHGYDTSGLTDVQLNLVVGAYADFGDKPPIVSSAAVRSAFEDGALQLRDGKVSISAVDAETGPFTPYLAALIMQSDGDANGTVGPGELRSAFEGLGYDTSTISDTQLTGLVARAAPSQKGVGGLNARGVESLLERGFVQLADGKATYHSAVLDRVRLREGLEDTGFDTKALADDEIDRIVATYSARGDGTLDATELSHAVDDGALQPTEGGGVIANLDALDNASIDYTAEHVVQAGAPGLDAVDRQQFSAGFASIGLRVTATPAELDALINTYGGGPDATTLTSTQLGQALDDGALVVSANGTVVADATAGAARRRLQTTEVGAGGDDEGTVHITVKGGVWANAKTANVELAHPELASLSNAYAQRLVAGETIQDIFGPRPSNSQANAMGDAYEMLGISDRQIALYAKNAEGEGPHIPLAGLIPFANINHRPWHNTLRDAGRMRAAVDAAGADTLDAYQSQGLVPASNGLGSLTAASAIGAVGRGVQLANPSNHDANALRESTLGLILGQGATNGGAGDVIYPELSFSSAQTRAQQGRSLVRSTELEVEFGLATALPAEIRPQLPVAVESLQTSRQPWTQGSVTEVVAAANLVMQAIGADVHRNAQAALALPGNGELTVDEQHALYTDAVNKSLKRAGIALTASDISTQLFDAETSPAFAAVAGTSTDRQDLSYSVLGFFDPKALPAVEQFQKHNAPAQTASQQIESAATRTLLESLGSTQPGNTSDLQPPISAEDIRTAPSIVSQWVIASVRWGVAGASKAASAATDLAADVTPEVYDRAQATLTAILVRSADDPQGRYLSPNGNVIPGINNMADLATYAYKEAGIALTPAVRASIRNLGSAVGTGLNTVPVGVLLSVASMTNRAYRLANPENLQIDNTTRAQLYLSIFADAMVIGEHALQPQRRGGAAMTAGIAGAERLVSSAVARLSHGDADDFVGLAGLPDWDRALSGFAEVVPPVAGPQTGVGRFLERWLPQAGGAANLIYGGFNLKQGIEQLKDRKWAQGALTAGVGVIDVFNGLVQLKRAISPANVDNLWSGLRDVGYAYPEWAGVTTRLIASAAGAAQAGLSGAQIRG